MSITFNQMINPIALLSITQIHLQDQNTQQQRQSLRYNDEPILCYVQLDDKIQDVRGICRDQTTLKLSNQSENIMIQVKKGSSTTYGYCNIPIMFFKEQKHIKSWFPLTADKNFSVSASLQQQNIEGNKIYVDIQIQEELLPAQQNRIVNAQSSNPFKVFGNSVNFVEQTLISTNEYEDNQNKTYQEISDNITLIQGQPFQESQKIITQSLGQQIFKKKKKTYTQSATPQIQLIPQTIQAKQQESDVLTPDNVSNNLIDNELLQLLQPNVDKQYVKQELITHIDQSMAAIVESSSTKFIELTNWYQNVKQISQHDSKDAISNERRQILINKIYKDQITLINNEKQQENIKQQLETQLKLLQVHGGIPQKSDKLSNLQGQVAKLKQDLQHLEDHKSILKQDISDESNNGLDNNDIESSSQQLNLTSKINYQKQELQMLLQLCEQRINTKSVQEYVLEEIDLQNSNQHNQQIYKDQQIYIQQEEQTLLDNELIQVQSLLHQLQNQYFDNNQQQEKQELEIEFLNKQLQAEQQSFKNYEKNLSGIILKSNQQTTDKQIKLQLLKEDITTKQLQLQELENQINTQKQLYSQFHKSESVTTLNQINDIDILIQKLQQSLEENKLELSQYYNNLQLSDTRISEANMLSILQVTQDINQKIIDKQDLLNTKIQKCNEVQSDLENVTDQIEYNQYKQDIYSIFEKKLLQLGLLEKKLIEELINIQKVNESLQQQSKDSLEKIYYQQNDFKLFEQEQDQLQQNQNDLRQKEKLALDNLLQLKTKQDLEVDMNLKLFQIRQYENDLRNKDHEIDTLELIQTQKDANILELEEQAGKFREVIKEVHYESQKHDKVEEALRKFIKMQPSQIQIKKLGDGYYKFGTRRIYIKLDNRDMNTLLVRVAPKEYITLNMFIIENESIELAKINGTSTIIK